MKENAFKLAKERSRRYPAQTITDVDYADDIAFLANSLAQAESLPHSMERKAGDIGLHVNADKTEYMCFNQRGDISTLKSGPLNHEGSILSPETDMDSYRYVIVHMEVRPDWLNKKQFFLGSGCVDAATWVHHKEAN